ncbi:MAG: hypothetical protein LBV71_11875 [Prevotella sp.]|jgi:hypothetical protein|nr:hypothetical protein [Prevotella sp.]
MMKALKLFLFIQFISGLTIYAQDRWVIQQDGAIQWNIADNIPHNDHIEMSGEQISTVFRYGVNTDGSFSMERSVIWPLLRTIPNNTHGSLMQRFAVDFPSLLMVNGMSLNNEKVKYIRLDGFLTVVSDFSIERHNIAQSRASKPEPVVELSHLYFPSKDKPLLCEKYILKNISDKPLTLIVPKVKNLYKTDAQKGVGGSYNLSVSLLNDGLYHLNAGEQIEFGAYIEAYRESENEIIPDISQEEEARKEFINEIWNNLEFKCPDPVINRAFAFAKIRTSESIFKTKGGYMHGPGGESYYAAIWANDQAEYVNPFFPFLGYKIGNESVFNSFMHFARFMNPEYNPIPSSIIAEGLDIWNGAGDRGDAAMIAYGAARYALARADREEAIQLWPLIEWCLEFCKRKLNKEGVVMSDNDELEGRFPAGEANLCTSSLYYDALISSSYLANEINKPSQVSKKYIKEAEALKEAINKYFGRTVEGYDTYQYYEGNDILRSWIAIPLTVNIFDRKEGTIEALFSPRLWTKNGLLTQAGTETFWDRSTLYALRGVYSAGVKEKATEYMKRYSNERLLGDHVPYPIEAWPEGNQRHLSAESGLYCRIITEGLFGIRPTGFRSFTLAPQLPDNWDRMELNNIMAFMDSPFSIQVLKNGGEMKVQLIKNEKVFRSFDLKYGENIEIKL